MLSYILATIEGIILTINMKPQNFSDARMAWWSVLLGNTTCKTHSHGQLSNYLRYNLEFAQSIVKTASI